MTVILALLAWVVCGFLGATLWVLFCRRFRFGTRSDAELGFRLLSFLGPLAWLFPGIVITFYVTWTAGDRVVGWLWERIPGNDPGSGRRR